MVTFYGDNPVLNDIAIIKQIWHVQVWHRDGNMLQILPETGDAIIWKEACW